MLRSVEKRRDKDARFFKPTALVAVIDGIADGSLSPADIDPDRVVERFDSYLRDILPERASSGWRPFWHLSRDGAWIFEREQHVVGPEDFGTQRKPNSRRELMAKIDRVFVPPALRHYWRDPGARGELRAAVIAMLDADDPDSRLVADRLRAFGNGGSADQAGAAEDDAEIGGALARDDAGLIMSRGLSVHGVAGGKGQGFRTSLQARRAVELHAMATVRVALESEGWSVTDMSLSESYDLLGKRDVELCHVEVKGTVGSGERVIVTRAEVAFARRNPGTMRLAVVSEIMLVPGGAKALVAEGGRLRMIAPWMPEDMDLEAISFFCAVPID